MHVIFQGTITGSGFSAYQSSLTAYIICPTDLSIFFIPACMSPAHYRRVERARIVPLTVYNMTDTEVNLDMTYIGAVKKPSYIDIQLSHDMPSTVDEIDA